MGPSLKKILDLLLPTENAHPPDKFPCGKSSIRKFTVTLPPRRSKKCTHFPITNTMRKQWVSHIAERPLPRGFGSHVVIYAIVNWPFN